MATGPDDALTRHTRHEQLRRRAATPPPPAAVEEVIEAVRAIAARHPGLAVTVTVDDNGTPTTARITARTGTPEVIRLVPTPDKPVPDRRPAAEKPTHRPAPPPDHRSLSAARLADLIRRDPDLLEEPAAEVLPHPRGTLPRRPEPLLREVKPLRYPYPDRPPYPD
jgi:hypothetical protein